MSFHITSQQDINSQCHQYYLDNIHDINSIARNRQHLPARCWIHGSTTNTSLQWLLVGKLGQVIKLSNNNLFPEISTTNLKRDNAKEYVQYITLKQIPPYLIFFLAMSKYFKSQHYAMRVEPLAKHILREIQLGKKKNN